MGMLRLTVLRGPLTAALAGGAIDAASAGLEVAVAESVDASTRAVLEGQVDGGEASLAAYVRAREDGADVVALPIFPSRRFLQQGLLVRRDTPLRPVELRGRRIGASQYWLTASVWHRHLLRTEHGIAPGEIVWVLAAEERLRSLRIPTGVRFERVADGRPVGQILLDGDVDAIVLPNPDGRGAPPPESVTSPYEDVAVTQLEYGRRTGVFPVLHVIVVQAAVARDARAIDRLVAALNDAKALAAADGTLPPPIRGQPPDVLGDDPYSYGLGPNEPTIDAFLDAAVDQGLVTRRPAIGDLFAAVSL